jgi:hypothetical protein
MQDMRWQLAEMLSDEHGGSRIKSPGDICDYVSVLFPVNVGALHRNSLRVLVTILAQLSLPNNPHCIAMTHSRQVSKG